MSTTMIPLVFVVAACALGSGCTRSDWIGRTLVTVDVTGVWVGTGTRVPYGPIEIRLELEQEGPKVNGRYRVAGGGPTRGFASGQIDGTVAGDTFTFKQPNGTVAGVVTVSGDEMEGSLEAAGKYRAVLRRVLATVPRSP